ncbi:MAG: hypothetical protein ABEJ55_04165 [Halanaeroarchaeum sp.]
MAAITGRALTRFDALLLAIPVSFLSTYLLGLQIFATEAVTVGMAALVSLAFVVDGLFVHPPAIDA